MQHKKKSRQWNRRWFKLTSTRLRFFKARTDTKEAGHIQLTDVTFVTDDHVADNGRRRCLHLATRSHSYVMYADSQAELAEWYPHVQMLCTNSTNFQQPDERSAHALASSLALIPDNA